MSKRKGLVVAIAVGTLVAVGLFTGRPGRTGAGAAPGPNILLVTFDTTRADHIGAYGWRHARTPALDLLAQNGVKFTRAYAPVPLTLPSHAAMMTGLYPFYNGVRDNIHFRLDPRAHTLAERLAEQGYQTCAVVAAFVLDHRFGLDQGFEEYRDQVPGREQFQRFQIPTRNARKVVDDAIDWLNGAQGDRPFFLWCHFYDPHHPYLTPQTFPFYLGNSYDQEIAFADYHLQRLLTYLEQSAPNDRPTIVVVTSDHGESLGEHGEQTHGYFVYDSTLRVPLVIQVPGEANPGHQVDSPVSLVDIMPTILELAGLPVPPQDRIHGRSLVGLVNGDPAASEMFDQRPIYFECYGPQYSMGWAPVRGVRVDQAKYIDTPVAELYLFADQEKEGARHNVYEQNPGLAATLDDALHALLDTPLGISPLTSAAQSPDADVIQKLRSLGYLASSTNPPSQNQTDDDLKEMLGLYNKILSALDAIGSGNVEAGTRAVLAVLRDDPDNPRALWLLAEAVATHPRQAAQGRPILEQAARNADFSPAMRVPFLINCGRAYLSENDPARALTFFQEALALDPDNSAHLTWACVAQLHLGQRTEALEAARLAAEAAPQDPRPLVQLGIVQFCNDQPQEAIRTWQQVVAMEDHALSPWDVGAMSSRDPVIAAMALEPLARAASDQALPVPVRTALHASVGQILFNVGQYGPASSALNAAAKLSASDDVKALWWRSKAAASLGRLDEARQILQLAHEHDRDQMVVVVDLATVSYRLGDVDAAIKVLSDYYEAHSEDATAANNLAGMLAEQAKSGPDLDRALRLAKYAAKRHPSSPDFADTLGWVHIKRGDGESAVFALSRAVKLSPDHGEYHYHLGLACALDGQTDRATKAFATAVQLAPSPRPDWYEQALERAGSPASNSGNPLE